MRLKKKPSLRQREKSDFEMRIKKCKWIWEFPITVSIILWIPCEKQEIDYRSEFFLSLAKKKYKLAIQYQATQLTWNIEVYR